MTKLVRLADGSLIEDDVLGVILTIQEQYGDKIRVQYLDPSHADVTGVEAPYRIIEIDKLGRENFLFSVFQLDNRVLQKLAEMDSHKVDVLAQQELEAKKLREAEIKAENEWRQEEAIPLIARAVKDDKSFSFKNEEGETVTLTGDKVVKR